MENILKLIFLLNSVSGPIAMLIIAVSTRKRIDILSISDYVRVGKDPLILLEVVLMSANVIQGMFCLYLYLNHGFPVTILLGTLAGIIGVVVSFTRIDFHFKVHISLTIVALLCYSLSVFLTSILLGNRVLFITSLIQVLTIPIGYPLKLKTKHLEVVYFTLLGIWNILVFAIFFK
ncbi:MAG: hypothetical protein ACMG57_01320 [Candidatus Dojkabacteria bacterium]